MTWDEYIKSLNKGWEIPYTGNANGLFSFNDLEDPYATPEVGVGINPNANKKYKYYTPFNETEEGKLLYKDYMDKLNAYKGLENFKFSQKDKFADIQEKIEKYGPFNYDINDDALYQQYVDQYMNTGKLASQDVMGQAAALTGGYGNSYAQGVSQQQYNAYLQQLNEMAPEFEERAYKRHMQGLDDLYNEYGLLMSEYEREMSDYNAELSKLYNDYAISADTYNSANTEYMNNFNIENTEKWNQIGYEDSQNASTSAGTGSVKYEGDGPLTGATVPSSLANVSGLTTTNTKLFDENGQFMQASPLSPADKDEDGNWVYDNLTWVINGKEVTYAKGVNPYTGTKNPDLKYGALKELEFSYIPNNIDGHKIESYVDNDGEPINVDINGVPRRVYQCEGKTVVWDDANNKWISVDLEEV